MLDIPPDPPVRISQVSVIESKKLLATRLCTAPGKSTKPNDQILYIYMYQENNLIQQTYI